MSNYEIALHSIIDDLKKRVSDLEEREDLRERVDALEELTTKQAQEIAALQGHDDEADGEDE